MKYILNIILCLTILEISAQGPNLLFAKGFGGIDVENSNSIAVDVNKNIYVAGDFMNIVDFNPGAGVATQSCTGVYDLFFSKFDASGNYIWSKTIGTSARATVNNIVPDKLGNIYITGYFEATADFDPGPGTATLTPIGTSKNFFFAKYNSSGSYLWAKSLEGGFASFINSLALDSLGNIHLTGKFNGTIDMDPGPATATLSTGLFFSEYDSNGNYIWAKGIPSGSPCESYNIKVDLTGNSYITGYFQGIVDFDPGPALDTLTGGNQSIFFAKYDNFGNHIFSKKIGISGYTKSFDLSFDSNKNIYLTGVFLGKIDFDPSPGTATITAAGFGDIFFAKYNSLGNYVWVKTMGGVGWEEGYSITNDVNDNIYLTGYFTSTIDIDPGSAVQTLSASGQPEIFLAKYDTSGNYIWAKSFGSSNYDTGNKIVLDNIGDIYLTGLFALTVDFNPGPGTTNLTSNGSNSDIFFAKYSSTVNGLLENKNNSIAVILSPNPNNGNFNLKLEKEIEKGEIILTNAIGQELYRQALIKGENNIKVKDLTKGIYFYSIRQNNQQLSSGKLIIE